MDRETESDTYKEINIEKHKHTETEVKTKAAKQGHGEKHRQ
jgi:hypothetical protein